MGASEEDGGGAGPPTVAEPNEVELSDDGVADLKEQLSEEQLQQVYDHLYHEFLQDGRTEEEAQQKALQCLNDRQWLSESALHMQRQPKISTFLTEFFAEYVPELLDKVQELSTEYSGHEEQLCRELRTQFAELGEEALAKITQFEDRCREWQQLEVQANAERLATFLLSFFNLYPPWDGQEVAEKAQELLRDFAAKETWQTLHSYLLSVYPRAGLELQELLNMAREGTLEATGGVEEQQYPVNSMSTTESSTQPVLTKQMREAGEVYSNPPREPAPVLYQREEEDEIRVVPSSPSRAAPGPPVASPSRQVSRETWLERNAAIARKYQERHDGNCLGRLVQEIAISPGYRMYLTAWLVGGYILSVLYGYHASLAILSRMFVPTESGFWPTLSLFCCLVLLMFFLGSFLLHAYKAVEQWVFLTDEIYYGDQDFADLCKRKGELFEDRYRKERRLDPHDGVYKTKKEMERAGHVSEWDRAQLEPPDPEVLQSIQNPVPPHLQHLLPPSLCRTFWGLPSGKGFVRREMWMGVLVLFTILLPFLFSLGYAGATGRNLLFAVAVFVEWNTVCGMCILLALWLLMWTMSTREKYGAWRRHRQAGESQQEVWYNDPTLLMEWGLDQRTVAVNLGILVLVLLPFLLMFWVISRTELTLSITWIVMAIVIVAVMLLVREVVQNEDMANKTPFVVLFLLAVFLLLGLIGSAKGSASLAGVFITLVFMSQATLLRHKHIATADVDVRQYTADVEERLGLLARDYDTAVVPLEKVSREVRRVGRKYSSRSEGVERWLPCSGFIGAIFSCCGGESSGKTPRKHWEMSRGYTAVVGDDTPKDKQQLIFSPTLLLWYMATFLVVMGCLLGFTDSFRNQSRPTALRNPTAWDTPSPSYPVCQYQWDAGLRVTDMALLASLAYTNSSSRWETDFPTWFPDLVLVRPKGPDQSLTQIFADHYGEDENAHNDSSSATNWIHLYNPTLSHHILLPRSNMEGRHRLRDVDLWGDSVLYQVFRHLFPILRLFPEDIEQKFVSGLAFFKGGLDGNHHPEQHVKALTEYAQRLACNQCTVDLYYGANRTVTGGRVTLVGHGVNGGVAKIVGSQLGLPTVAFGSPGTSWLERRLNIDPNPLEVSVEAMNDPVADIDSKTGVVQYIRCFGNGNMMDCNDIATTACELARVCGDRLLRSHSSCPLSASTSSS